MKELLINTLLAGAIVLMYVGGVTSIAFPAQFGKWLQTIDNARYEFTMGE